MDMIRRSEEGRPAGVLVSRRTSTTVDNVVNRGGCRTVTVVKLRVERSLLATIYLFPVR
jgi:hypothetical protein